MPYYVVQQGDTILRIAYRNGFPRWETVWEHVENANLRRLRPDPQVLHPGDQVFVPDSRPKSLDVQPGKIHVFRKTAIMATLRLIIEDESGRPCSGKPFSLKVGPSTLEGNTNSTGLLELKIDPDPQNGELTVWPDGRPGRTLQFTLQLGSLNPIDTTSGAKARLRNLGFDPGSVEGDIDDQAQEAIRTFQIVAGLDVTGELDSATRDALEKAHDRK